MLLTYACNVSLHDSDPVKGKDYQHKKHRLQFIIKHYAFFMLIMQITSKMSYIQNGTFKYHNFTTDIFSKNKSFLILLPPLGVLNEPSKKVGQIQHFITMTLY